MQRYERICIIGNSGAGKSTLARRLSAVWKLPICHLDKIYWSAHWQRTDKAFSRAEIAKVIAEEKWIIDGNNKSTFDIRFPRAQAVVFLDYNCGLCLYRVLRRLMTRKIRQDMPAGCPEHLDFHHYWYVLNYRRKMCPAIFGAVEKYKDNLDFYHLKNSAELEKLLLEWEI